MVRHMVRAYSMASSSETWVYLRKYENGFWKAVSRSLRKRLRYQVSMSSARASTYTLKSK